MQARTLLGLLAVMQVLAVCLNFTLASWIIFATLPFALLGLLALFIAIWCRWKSGIYIFIFLSTCLGGYAFVMIWIIVSKNEITKHPLDFTWYLTQLLVEVVCISVATWVLFESHWQKERDTKKSEKKPLLGK